MISLYSFESFTWASTNERRTPVFAPIPVLIKRPFVDTHTASIITDQSFDQLSAAIDDGRIAVAVNIAAATSGKRCVRILSSALAAYINQSPPPPIDSPAQLVDMFLAAFPALAPTISSTTFCAVLGCDSGQCVRLIREGSLKCANKLRRGPNGAGKIYRRSVIEFLVSRRIAAAPLSSAQLAAILDAAENANATSSATALKRSALALQRRFQPQGGPRQPINLVRSSGGHS